MIHFVGAGCGAPDLITLRGKKHIENADVIIYAGSLVNKELLQYAKKDCAVYDSAKMTLEEIIEVIAAAEGKGLTTVRLHTGDPSVYSTFAYLAPHIKNKGFDVIWVPGVTSFCASAAALGAPLCTDREELHVIPGGMNAGEALKLSGTKVFMKGELSPLLCAIKESGQNAQAVENCGIEDEHIYGTADAVPEDAGYYLVTIVKEKES